MSTEAMIDMLTNDEEVFYSVVRDRKGRVRSVAEVERYVRSQYGLTKEEIELSWANNYDSDTFHETVITAAIDSIDWQAVIDAAPPDDGENCWDCGEPNEGGYFNMCSTCHHTVCADAESGGYGHKPHKCGDERVLG
jgi:hypothetical protein